MSNALRLTFAVNGPAAAGLMAVGLPIVQLLFQHGRFHLADSQQTAAAVFWYGVGLPGYSAVKVLVPVFYALGTTRIPVITSFVMVGLNALLNHIFLQVLHQPFWCLAAATSATATLNAIVLAVILRTKLPGSLTGRLVFSVFLQAVVSAAIGFAIAGALHVLAPFETSLRTLWGGQFLFWGAEVGVALIVALLLWWGLGTVFKIPENQKAMSFILKRFRRTR